MTPHVVLLSRDNHWTQDNFFLWSRSLTVQGSNFWKVSLHSVLASAEWEALSIGTFNGNSWMANFCFPPWWTLYMANVTPAQDFQVSMKGTFLDISSDSNSSSYFACSRNHLNKRARLYLLWSTPFWCQSITNMLLFRAVFLFMQWCWWEYRHLLQTAFLQPHNMTPLKVQALA